MTLTLQFLLHVVSYAEGHVFGVERLKVEGQGQQARGHGSCLTRLFGSRVLLLHTYRSSLF